MTVQTVQHTHTSTHPHTHSTPRSSFLPFPPSPLLPLPSPHPPLHLTGSYEQWQILKAVETSYAEGVAHEGETLEQATKS